VQQLICLRIIAQVYVASRKTPARRHVVGRQLQGAFIARPCGPDLLYFSLLVTEVEVQRCQVDVRLQRNFVHGTLFFLDQGDGLLQAVDLVRQT